MQYLLNRAVWESDEVRDVLQTYVREMIARFGGMLVIDETGFLKKGKKSVGVQRQYSGTAGRIENCQIGVFLTYESQGEHTLVDREWYLRKAVGRKIQSDVEQRMSQKRSVLPPNQNWPPVCSGVPWMQDSPFPG